MFMSTRGTSGGFVEAADPTVLSKSIRLDPTGKAGTTRNMAVDSTKGLTASVLAPVGPVTPSESDKALHSWVRRLAVASVLGGLALAALLIWTACEPSDHGVTVNLDGVA